MLKRFHIVAAEAQHQKKKKKSETSKEPKSSSGSKSFKEKELDDKIRFAKLAAEAELLEHKQMVETQKQM